MNIIDIQRTNSTINVEMALKNKRIYNVLDNSSLSDLTAAMLLIPTATIHISENMEK